MPDKITVIGLGYVGLPLARLFATKYSVVGFDLNENRISELKKACDHTLEVSKEDLEKVLLDHNPKTGEIGLFCTTNINEIADSNIYIVTVPTPVDKRNKPDLTAIYAASETVGKVIKKNDTVIYESTVYPGVTEDECIPIIENFSKLQFNQDFFVGYSPERVNPGDKLRTIEKVKKVTSGSTPETAKRVDNLYKSVIEAGTHLAPSIKVAEAAKVIENSQRDINIAFVNELAKIFNLMDIDTHEVLKAAGTKWNFLPFEPGLVGGHCIGVDPYYLAQKAIEFGYHPEIILAGRRMNDSMAPYIASEVVKMMLNKDLKIKNANALVLGITFKENCTDVRNSKVFDLVQQLSEFGLSVDIYDPWVDAKYVKDHYSVNISTSAPNKKYDTVILAVAHADFQSININSFLKKGGLIYDVKGVLESSSNMKRL